MELKYIGQYTIECPGGYGMQEYDMERVKRELCMQVTVHKYVGYLPQPDTTVELFAWDTWVNGEHVKGNHVQEFGPESRNMTMWDLPYTLSSKLEAAVKSYGDEYLKKEEPELSDPDEPVELEV